VLVFLLCLKPITNTPKMSKETILNLLNMGKDGLVSTFNAVPEDKVDWKPLENGRTALDLLSEAAQFSELATLVANSKGQIDASFNLMGLFQQKKAERVGWTKEKALETLEANHNAMIAAIEALTEEELNLPVSIAMRSGAIRPVDFWIMMTHRTYIARFAQINYIQTLYGDTDFH